MITLWRSGKTVRFPRLTLFGRSVLLLTAELLANAICWVVSAVLFGRKPETRPVLSLALLAWVSAVAYHFQSQPVRS